MSRSSRIHLVSDNSGRPHPKVVKHGVGKRHPPTLRLLHNGKSPAMRNGISHAPLGESHIGNPKVATYRADDRPIFHKTKPRTDSPNSQASLWKDDPAQVRYSRRMGRKQSPKELRTRIAARLRDIRDGLELSQEEFAARLDCSQTRYSKYESARTAPPLEVLVSISRLTGLSIDFLVTGRALGGEDMAETGQLQKSAQR